MSEIEVGPTTVPMQDMTYPNVSMEARSQVGNKVQGLYLPGFIGGTRALWLIDTDAASLILSFKIYNSLPGSSAIALADGQQAKTHSLGHVVVHLGTKEFHMHVIVAEVEHEGILDFLSQVDSHIDIVKIQVSINGEVFECYDFKN